MKKSTKVTILDVANAAGVSTATVSRVINNPDKVKKNTIKLVYDAMSKVGYESKLLDPQKKRLNIILVMIPDIENPFYSKIVKGIHAAAFRCGFRYFLHQSGYQGYTIDAIRNLCYEINPAGIIFLEPIADVSLLEEINDIVPIVQCCEYNPNSNLSYVSVDDYSASKAIVEYMISKGCKKIAFINGPSSFKYAYERQNGYLAALREANLRINNNWIEQMTDLSYEPVISVVSQLLSMEDRPDAIFAASDTYGVAAIKAVLKNGYSVPADIRIAGFDNTYISSLCEPSLTTVKQPQFQLGNLACEILIEHILNPTSSPRHVILDTELVIRDSV